ncbi:MAG: sigma-70 family RNA polymerase sigma factor [Gemmatimonadaceae bacterium]|nr:sigma-70 family RNA polymerase sigma factor [Gemmatimonadaceae bacterium]NUP54619.1 sigma-70 family RNA polymerase sigma factor [Gemmatimonadaceae bacterium]NUR32501.1 sigma-70 family RNA polymerase sigma factor [Gemmatimonadaceae bacterium]NUS31586.1 sigma-70 family RNA polymerase sigma factor [Gemmatimonadaceae bacterium]
MRVRPLAEPTATAVIPSDVRTIDTAALVGAAQTGDRAAFGALYERFARLVHGVLLASAPRDDVPDLVQDVFLRALRQLHTLREPAAFGGWIATMARNEARMHHRSSRPTEALSDQVAGSTPSPETTAMDDVLRALRALPERYREPLTLRLVEQMGGEEIARTLGLTHGTVRVYLHHGIRLLREQLGHETTHG